MLHYVLLALLTFSVTRGTANGEVNDFGLAQHDERSNGYIFYNEVTGVMQLEDPGNVPYLDETGERYWLSPSGERLPQDPNREEYVWIESWSAEARRPYYNNQITREATWDRPADLAWRRIKVDSDS